jgi:hypothetical protein
LKIELTFLDEGCDVLMNENEIRVKGKIDGQKLFLNDWTHCPLVLKYYRAHTKLESIW